MLSAELLSQLESHMERLVCDVELVGSYDNSGTSKELRVLVEQVAGTSSRISVCEAEPSYWKPSVLVRRRDEHDVAVRFAGLPMGHEFSSFVIAILWVGGHRPPMDDATIERASSVVGTLHFETVFSQSCLNCPDVVQALTLLAVLNENVSHTALDGAAFKDEVERRAIQSVPAVFLNGKEFGFGRMTIDEILDKLENEGLLEGAQESVAPHVTEVDVLVVGGGPAGAAAAVYASRKGVRTALVAPRIGGQVLDTIGIENMISVVHTEGPQLARALESHVRAYPVEVVCSRAATQLTPQRDSAGMVEVCFDNNATIRTRAVVLAPGARWRQMGVPGENEYRNRGVTFCPHCDGPLFAGKRVAVVGGGNSGVEAAIDLAGLAAHVTLVEYGAELRADAVLQEALSRCANVSVITSARTTEVVGDSKQVTGLEYSNTLTGETSTLHVDGVFVQIGLVPNTEWLLGAVELNARGEIVVDAKGATNVPGVFAAGDATTAPFKQIIIAAGAGATAALSAFEYLVFNPTVSSAEA